MDALVIIDEWRTNKHGNYALARILDCSDESISSAICNEQVDGVYPELQKPFKCTLTLAERGWRISKIHKSWKSTFSRVKGIVTERVIRSGKVEHFTLKCALNDQTVMATMPISTIKMKGLCDLATGIQPLVDIELSDLGAHVTALISPSKVDFRLDEQNENSSYAAVLYNLTLKGSKVAVPCALWDKSGLFAIQISVTSEHLKRAGIKKLVAKDDVSNLGIQSFIDASEVKLKSLSFGQNNDVEVSYLHLKLEKEQYSWAVVEILEPRSARCPSGDWELIDWVNGKIVNKYVDYKEKIQIQAMVIDARIKGQATVHCYIPYQQHLISHLEPGVDVVVNLNSNKGWWNANLVNQFTPLDSTK